MNKLTNIDIMARLTEIRQIKNICDRTEALLVFNKTYQKTAFYHRTHRSLQSLYSEFVTEDLLTLRSLLTSVQDFLNNLDAEHFTEMLEQVNADTLRTVNQGIDLFTSLGLNDLVHK